ncbi:ABC transporter ATP-binding protein [Lutibaculum baratangense]|uniref:Ferric iron ABC transporter, ATP-binding protein n=1 Tax=Lutibaculum baratangense AMV1 TaxID=631454 RepID=V4RDU1_9HYPH|nr:Ferric iron ABC transporter, ATP-binding protein [Lutibaculum baratangense AMV1]
MFGLSDLPRAEAERSAMTALRRVGLEGYAELYPHLLSGGEQQRVALARAVAPRPRILLMDEPFSGLDARLRDDVREDTIAVLREIRATCIVVTHDPEEAMRMGDRIALMRKGRLAQAGTPEELYRRPADMAAARFFSPINEIQAVCEAGLISTPIGRLPAARSPQVGAGGGGVRVGLRPHHLRIVPMGEGARARVVGRRFLGEVEHVELVVEGVDERLQVRADAGAVPSIGTEVGVTFREEDALVFTADPDATDEMSP